MPIPGLNSLQARLKRNIAQLRPLRKPDRAVDSLQIPRGNQLASQVMDSGFLRLPVNDSRRGVPAPTSFRRPHRLQRQLPRPLPPKFVNAQRIRNVNQPARQLRVRAAPPDRSLSPLLLILQQQTPVRAVPPDPPVLNNRQPAAHKRGQRVAVAKGSQPPDLFRQRQAELPKRQLRVNAQTFRPGVDTMQIDLPAQLPPKTVNVYRLQRHARRARVPAVVYQQPPAPRDRPPDIHARRAARAAPRRLVRRAAQQNRRLVVRLHQPRRDNADNPRMPVGIRQNDRIEVQQNRLPLQHVKRRLRDLAGQQPPFVVQPLHLRGKLPRTHRVIRRQQLHRRRRIIQPAQRVHTRPDLKSDRLGINAFQRQAGALHQCLQPDPFCPPQPVQPDLKQVARVMRLLSHVGNNPQRHQVQKLRRPLGVARQTVQLLRQLVGYTHPGQRTQRIVLGQKLGVHDRVGPPYALRAGNLRPLAARRLPARFRVREFGRQVMVVGNHHCQPGILRHPDPFPVADARVARHQRLRPETRILQQRLQLRGADAVPFAETIRHMKPHACRPGQLPQRRRQQGGARLPVYVEVPPHEEILPLPYRLEQRMRRPLQARQRPRPRRRIRRAVQKW